MPSSPPAPETVSLSSSNLASATYDGQTDTLTIQFVDGSEYDYMNVPPAVFTGLKAAGSAGGYFLRHIKNRYSYEKA